MMPIGFSVLRPLTPGELGEWPMAIKTDCETERLQAALLAATSIIGVRDYSSEQCA